MINKEQTNIFNQALHQLRATDEEKRTAKHNDCLWDDKIAKINTAIDSIEAGVKMDNVRNNAADLVRQVETKSFKFGQIERKQLSDYLRKGTEPSGTLVDQNFAGGSRIQISSSKGTPGYSATYSIADSIYEYLAEYSIMRKLCNSIIVSRDSLDVPMTKSDIACQWENGSTIAPPSDSMVMNSIKTFELTAQPKVTQKMIDDTVIDLESWLVEKLAALFLTMEDEAFIAGDGSSKPKGILSYKAPTGSTIGINRVKSGLASEFNEDSLLSLYYSLDDYYSVNASFIMNKATLQQIRTFKDSNTGQYYWMPGVLFGKADTLLGCSVYTSGHVPTVAANADVIIYGDMRRLYQIVDRSEITIQRDPYSSKPFVVFYATKRVGGDIIEPAAGSVLQIGV
ncbi:MAG: phage major capsid protein [Alphaproteobacteria bacterium]|nr:phage major capsid protein [Rickettsiales bacterium]